MRAEIIPIGDELLLGIVKEETSYHIIKFLTENGVRVERVTIIPDNKKEIVDAIRRALEKGVEIIVTSGGLGPTEDDMTVDAVAEALNRNIVVNSILVRRINAECKAFKERALRMARVIENSKTFLSPFGFAPAQLIKESNSYIILLPGPPKEAIALFKQIFNEIKNPNKCLKAFRKRIYLRKREAEIADFINMISRKYNVYVKPLVAEHTREHGLPVEILAFCADRDEFNKKVKEILSAFSQQNLL